MQTANRKPQTAKRLALKRTLTAVALGAACCTFTMCSKEAAEPMAEAHGAGSISTEAILSKIQRFRGEQRKEFREKSTTYYTLEEAKLVVEGTFNWGTVDPEAKYGEMKEDEYSVTVMVTDGKVSEDDLLAAYAELEMAMNADALGADEKFHLMDVEAKEENGDLVLTTYRISSKDVPGPVGSGLNTNYTSSHRGWNGYAGCSTTAADQMIQERINQAIGLLPSVYTVINVQRWEVRGARNDLNGWTPYAVTDIPNRKLAATLFPNPNDPDGIEQYWNTLDAFNDYRTYYTPQSLPMPSFQAPTNSCLSPEGMSYLTQNAYDLMGIIRNSYVQNYLLAPISCKVEGWRTTVQNPLNNAQFIYGMGHNVTFTFGQLIPNLPGTAG